MAQTAPSRPVITNAAARRLFLHRHGLGTPTTGTAKGADLLGVIRRLGFVQVDSINMVERAHHMIIHARRHNYRPENMRPLLERDRSLFEHWTHDAAIIPTEFYPHWQLHFVRDAVTIAKRWKNWRRDGFEDQFETVLTQIRDHGPVGTGDVGTDEKRGSGGWWDWHPSKTALEYLWRTGQLSVTRRVSFRKIYDLTDRVFSPETLSQRPDAHQTIDWACANAIDRLGFATSGEIAAFWDKITPAEARDWCVRELASGTLCEVDVQSSAAPRSTPDLRRSFMRPETLDAPVLPPAPDIVRILSPFDPMLRDRKRAERLFGFHYRIEVFVPAKDRKYGYYVFPVLQGERLIGRIDMKCNRADQCLNVTAFWPEAGVKMGKTRRDQLHSALERTAKFAGANQVSYAPDWQRP
jgi:uncharacterized protein YcaQ